MLAERSSTTKGLELLFTVSLVKRQHSGQEVKMSSQSLCMAPVRRKGAARTQQRYPSVDVHKSEPM